MNWVRQHGWWVLAAILAMVTVFGVTDIVSGAQADPPIARALTGMSLAELEAESIAAFGMYDFMTRANGYLLVMFGLLGLAVLLFAYRRGERWAWWAMWLVPVWAAGVPVFYLVNGLAPGEPLPPPMISGPIIAVVGAVALLTNVPRDSSPATEEAPQRREPLEPASGL
jgi:hypothetical protein